MCKCTPQIRTPYCGKGDCVWPHEKEGVRSDRAEELKPCWYVKDFADGWIKFYDVDMAIRGAVETGAIMRYSITGAYPASYTRPPDAGCVVPEGQSVDDDFEDAPQPCEVCGQKQFQPDGNHGWECATCLHVLNAAIDRMGWPEINEYHAQLRRGQSIYEDAGGYMLRCIKALFGLKPDTDSVVTYQEAARALLTAAPQSAQKERE